MRVLFIEVKPVFTQMLRIFTLLIRVIDIGRVTFSLQISPSTFFVISLLFLFLGVETHEYKLQGLLARVYAH